MKKNMIHIGILCFGFLLIGSVAFGGTIFGPQTYIRTTGAPNIYDDTFTATPGPGRLVIKNGEANKKHRVTSALIYVNEDLLFGTEEFKQGLHIMEAPVELDAVNTLHIKMDSKPGTFLQIDIYQEPARVTFSAEPDEIDSGGSVLLSWTTTLADTVVIDNGVGEMPLNGSISIAPMQSTIYTITATGAGGSSSESIQVTVIPPPTVDLTAVPNRIYNGGAVTLSWISEHAEFCEINPDIGQVVQNGSIIVAPEEIVTYTITAMGPGGTAEDVVSVSVMPQLEIDDETFDEGIFENVEHYQNYLQLTSGVNTLPFIWVANSGEGTVSKINTITGEELGRYRTGPTTGTNPSRTTVDSDGNLWVGNRDTASAVKIALYPRDKNGDGTVVTSTGAANVLPWGQDEAIELYLSGVDTGPRALAVDALNNVWIGGYGRNMGYYDGQTGQKLKNIYIGRDCYGALIDANGTLWISNKTSGLTRIDSPSGTHNMVTISTGGKWVYGIGIDPGGFIYTSGYTDNRLRKLDPATNAWIYDVSVSGGYQGRGVAVGIEGDAWVAHTGTDRVTRHDSETGALKATVYVGDQPTGVAVDSEGKIWVTNLGSNSVQRINPETDLVEFTQFGHTYPYNYSDMTGYISRNITSQNGQWSIVFDSEAGNTPWGVISWDSYEPPGTQIKVKSRTSQDQSLWSQWEEVGSGVIIENLPAGRYIEVEVTLTILSGDESPLLYGLSIASIWEGFSNTPPEITSNPVLTADEGVEYIYPVTATDAEDAVLYYSLQSAPEGMSIDMNTGVIIWALDAYKAGGYLVSVKVKDPIGAHDLQHFTLTVSDTLQCNSGEMRVCGSSVGTCQMGAQTCYDGMWGECVGEIAPEPEICDGLDNNCNLEVDEGLTPASADKQCGVCEGATKVCGGADGWQEPDYSEISGYEPYETLNDGRATWKRFTRLKHPMEPN